MKTYKTFADLKVGDCIYNMSQGYHGEWSTELFIVNEDYGDSLDCCDAEHKILHFRSFREPVPMIERAFAGNNILFADLDCMEDMRHIIEKITKD